MLNKAVLPWEVEEPGGQEHGCESQVWVQMAAVAQQLNNVYELLSSHLQDGDYMVPTS